MYWVSAFKVSSIISIADEIFEIDKARRTKGTTPDTPCSFYTEPSQHDREGIANLASGPAIAADDEESADIIHNTASRDILELWPWVNQESRFHISTTP